jgi:cell wall-associated NlpC family hydrolase
VRELAIFSLFAVIGLLSVLNNSLAAYKPPEAQSTPVVVTAPLIMPTPAAPVPTISATPIPGAPGMPGDFVAAVIADARRWLGVPYLWGGCTTRGVDCSCFVRNVLADFGYALPRTTTEQVRWATPVRRADVQPLDLIFYDNTCTDCGPNPTHVAMYIGNGLMINAGNPVQIAPAFDSHFAEIGRPHK